MEVYIIRHGEAVDLDNEIVDEGFRYLNSEGRKRAFAVAQKLKQLKTKFDVIFSSPLVRSVQTAEIFASVLRYKGELKTAIELMGGCSFARFQQLLRRNSRHKSIACFGHAPDVVHFAEGLLNNRSVKEMKIHFHNCSVFKTNYDLEKDNGEFIYFLESTTMNLIRD